MYRMGITNPQSQITILHSVILSPNSFQLSHLSPICRIKADRYKCNIYVTHWTTRSYTRDCDWWFYYDPKASWILLGTMVRGACGGGGEAQWPPPYDFRPLFSNDWLSELFKNCYRLYVWNVFPYNHKMF